MEQKLIAKIKTLSPQQMIEVEDFIDFLVTKRKTALDRLLAIAPALEAAGIETLTEEQIMIEVETARQERYNKLSNNM